MAQEDPAAQMLLMQAGLLGNNQLQKHTPTQKDMDKLLKSQKPEVKESPIQSPHVPSTPKKQKTQEEQLMEALTSFNPNLANSGQLTQEIIQLLSQPNPDLNLLQKLVNQGGKPETEEEKLRKKLNEKILMVNVMTGKKLDTADCPTLETMADFLDKNKQYNVAKESHELVKASGLLENLKMEDRLLEPKLNDIENLIKNF